MIYLNVKILSHTFAFHLLIFLEQLRAIWRNQTGIEDWIIEKADYRRRDTKDKFLHPYHLVSVDVIISTLYQPDLNQNYLHCPLVSFITMLLLQ